jgi:hypothetical protein
VLEGILTTPTTDTNINRKYTWNFYTLSEALKAAKQTEEDFREQIVSRKCLGILTSQI